jgi:hypothetical protein
MRAVGSNLSNDSDCHDFASQPKDVEIEKRNGIEKNTKSTDFDWPNFCANFH